jgi:hypothetical protein
VDLPLNKDEYEPWRCIPTGQLVHCELNGAAGLRPFENKRPDFHVIGTLVNGVRVPDSGTPTTRPEQRRGGAGEVPSTKPTTAPDAAGAEQSACGLTMWWGRWIAWRMRSLNSRSHASVLRSSTQPSEVASAP